LTAAPLGVRASTPMRRSICISSAVLLAALAFAQVALAKAPPRGINDVYVVHFIVDGTNQKTFEEALEEGRLPTVKKRFYEEGAVFADGLSTFPTTSTSVYQAYSTGLFPGHAGIPHLERLDRQSGKVIGYLTVSGFDKVNSDFINLRALMNPNVARLQPPSTIFELLEGHPTQVVYSSFSRGAADRYPRRAPIRALWSTYVSEAPENVDVLAMKRVMKLFEGPAAEIPRYMLVGLYSSDISGHKYGPASPEVKDVLAQFDVFLRDFLKLLKRRGINEKTYVIISADHGMHETGKLFKLRAALEADGIRLKSSHPPRRDYALYVANRGVASSHIYIRHDGGFAPMADLELARRIPKAGGGSADLIETLKGLDATEFVIARSGARSATIFGKDGSRATARWYNVGGTDYVSYRTQGGDPLGHSKARRVRRLMDGEPHSTREWLEATSNERYPDAVVNLSQIFHDGRAGDIFVTSAGRYGFRKVKEGNHGGIVAGDMRTPFMMAGPTVPKGRLGAIRPVDVYPLLLSWFGIEVPQENFDGEDPFGGPRREDRSAQRLAAAEMRAQLGGRLGRRPGLARLAREELARRELLVERLGTLLGNMYEGGHSGGGIYAQDHIDIVKRSLALAQADRDRMKRVATQLGGRSGT